MHTGRFDWRPDGRRAGMEKPPRELACPIGVALFVEMSRLLPTALAPTGFFETGSVGEPVRQISPCLPFRCAHSEQHFRTQILNLPA